MTETRSMYIDRMSLCRLVGVELRRVFRSPFIYISVGTLFCAGWSQMVELANYTTGSALLALLGANDAECTFAASISALSLIIGYFSPYWFNLLFVVSTAICFALSFCDERTSGMIRFVMPRCSRRVYCAGKLLCSTLSSVLAVVLGFVAFCISACVFAPSIFSFSPEEIEQFLFMYSAEETPDAAVALALLSMPLSSMLSYACNAVFWSSVAMAIAAAKPNKYFVLALPAVLWYLWDKTLYGSPAAIKGWYCLADSNLLIGCLIEYLRGAGMGVALVCICLPVFMLARIAVPCAAFYFSMNRRVDLGAEY